MNRNRAIAQHLYGPELQVGAAVAGEDLSFPFEEKDFGFLDGGEDSMTKFPVVRDLR
jgi:hypothetical protein